MSINYNPQIVTNGLVLCLDAANAKSFDANENLYTYSEQLDNANWTKADSTIASNQTIAPDGTFTADKLIDNTNNNWHAVYQSINYTGNVTASIYAKYSNRQYLKFVTNNDNATDRGATFDLINKTVTNTSAGVTATIVDIGDGWVRVSVTSYSTGGGSRYYNWALATNSAGTYIYIGDGNGSVFLWGAQLEKSSSASRYYPTTGAAKSRGTNLVDISGNSKNGTLTNGPTYSAFNGGSFSLDGTDDHIIINHQLFPLSAFTFDLWFKPSNNDTLKIFWMNEMQIFFQTVSKNIYRRWYNNNATAIAFQESFTPNYASLWTNVCWTIGNLIDIVYINGSQVGPNRNTTISSPTITGFNGQTTSGIFIGRDEEAIYRAFDVASAKVYNRALTAAEIQQNFNALRGRFGV